jgi:hypothetical protein
MLRYNPGCWLVEDHSPTCVHWGKSWNYSTHNKRRIRLQGIHDEQQPCHQRRSQNLKYALSFQISDVKYMYFFLLISNIFYKIDTKYKGFGKKVVWSMTTQLATWAPPLLVIWILQLS